MISQRIQQMNMLNFKTLANIFMILQKEMIIYNHKVYLQQTKSQNQNNLIYYNIGTKNFNKLHHNKYLILLCKKIKLFKTKNKVLIFRNKHYLNKLKKQMKYYQRKLTH